MNTEICVPVSVREFIRLVGFLREKGISEESASAAVGLAIDYWIESARFNSDDLLQALERRPVQESRGYTWKHKNSVLFLPHGTEIRMRYKGKDFFAKVEDNDIHYEGESVSPATLANRIANSSRNAWRDLLIKRPGDRGWTLADNLRRPTLTLEDLGL